MNKQETINSIVVECKEQGLSLNEHVAYVLATAEWETNHTFKPIKEAYWLSEGWRERNLRYFPFYGRGYAQLTWEENYRKYSGPTNMDLVKYPDKVMEHEVAKFILVHGFKHGTFTGRRLEQYIDVERCDFYNARRCINGTDKATEIAQIAEEFLAGKEWDLPQ